jgi:hypothetical protein
LRIRLLALLKALLVAAALAQPAGAQDATSLRERHAALQKQLADNAFRRPLYIESRQAAGSLRSDVYAVMDAPYAKAAPALRPLEHWCDIFILHLNVKGCSASGGTLRVAMGRKFDQPVEDAYAVEFRYAVAQATADYERVVLTAASGPFGTKNYDITFEMTGIEDARTFMHLAYSYEYGAAARLAMEGYLATLGRNKVGFTVPGGVRGVIERNAMRYFVSIQTYLRYPDDLEKRLAAWYDETERDARQLHELERDEYLAMKRRETARR